MRLIMTKGFCVLALLALLAIAAGAKPAYSQAVIKQVVITRVTADQFPVVDVRVRVLGGDGAPLPTLGDNDLIVKENGLTVVYTHHTVRVGIRVALVFDLGAGITAKGGSGEKRIDEMKQAAQRFVDGMIDGDAVAIVTVLPGDTVFIAQPTVGTGTPTPAPEIQSPEPNSKTVQPLTSDKKLLKAAIDGINPGQVDSLSRGLVGIERGLTDLKSASETETAQAVLFFSSGIQAGGFDSEFSRIEGIASKSGIPIHAVGFGDTSMLEGLAQKLEGLAQKTGGQFAYYDSAAALDELYTLLDSHRTQYELSFRSTQSTTSERTITVSANPPDPAAPPASQAYKVTPAPPTILFTAPTADAVFTRTAATYNADLNAVEPTTTVVLAQVNWGDQVPRQIRRAKLLVNGELQGPELTDPGNQLSFPWDLSTYQTPGVTVPLQIQVEDELGLTATSEALLVSVDMVIPAIPGICDAKTGLERTWCEAYRDYSGLIAAIPGTIALIIAIPTLIIAVVAFRFRRNIGDAVEAVTNTMRNTLRFRAMTVKAYLIAMDGLTDAGRSTFPIYGTTPIGRDKRVSELLFHQADEKSPISGLHCTILDDAGEFKIRDEGSTNRTFVNGIEISEDETSLHDGDEIEVAPVERGGIRFTFRLASADGKLPEDAETTATQRVRKD